MTAITKLVLWTDIHWGARSNSEQHLIDCTNFIDWMIEQIKKEKPSHLAFLGDWYENRQNINVKTLNMSTNAARKLNDLGIPIIFIVGNHDLYHRDNREVCSTHPFKDLSNFIIIDDKTWLNDDFLAVPYLFKDEYIEIIPELPKAKIVLGHLEFGGFVVTGSTKTLEHGNDHKIFKNSEWVLSGHFHKRQIKGNIAYIGNSFPTNYGDAEDAERGIAILDNQNGKWTLSFKDWKNAPLFFKTALSRILAGDEGWPAQSRVCCVLDVDIGYSDVQDIKASMIEQYNLREFTVEEMSHKEIIEEGIEVDLSGDINDRIKNLIHDGVAATPVINVEKLISIYERL